MKTIKIVLFALAVALSIYLVLVFGVAALFFEADEVFAPPNKQMPSSTAMQQGQEHARKDTVPLNTALPEPLVKLLDLLDDIDDAASALENKGEFETSEEYRLRIANTLASLDKSISGAEFERFDIWAQVTELSLYDADTSCFSNGLVAKAEFSTKHGFRIISSEEVLGSENSYLYQLIERERGQISTAFSHLYPVRQRAGAMVVITSDKMRQQQPEDDTPHWYGWAHRSDDKLELTFTVGQETINVGDGSVVAGTNICFEREQAQAIRNAVRQGKLRIAVKNIEIQPVSSVFSEDLIGKHLLAVFWMRTEGYPQFSY